MAVGVRSHIHLSDALGDAPENAPDYTWAVHDRRPIPTVFINPRRGKTGKLFPNRLLESTLPVKVMNWKYQIRVQGDDAMETETLLQLLIGWQGKLVYLVDNVHCADGEDHTPHVQNMLFANMDAPKVDDWGLFRYYVDVTLESNEI
jgi:hypothetical protein